MRTAGAAGGCYGDATAKKQTKYPNVPPLSNSELERRMRNAGYTGDIKWTDDGNFLHCTYRDISSFLVGRRIVSTPNDDAVPEQMEKYYEEPGPDDDEGPCEVS